MQRFTPSFTPIFRLALASLCLAAVLSSCFSRNLIPDFVQGNGVEKSETRTVAAFTRIDNQMAVEINVTTKQTQRLDVSADENLLQYIKTEVIGGTLVISTDNFVENLTQKVPMRITISMQTLEAITNSGVGTITASPVETTRLNLILSGAGNILTSNVKVSELSSTISGVGKVQTQGSAERATVRLSGAGNLQARDLAVQNANVTVSGVGTAYVSVSQVLDATISGAGNIVYYGKPATLNSTVTGVGSVRQGN
jgi:Putative auto-transporter adhesin, head GIN domain